MGLAVATDFPLATKLGVNSWSVFQAKGRLPTSRAPNSLSKFNFRALSVPDIDLLYQLIGIRRTRKNKHRIAPLPLLEIFCELVGAANVRSEDI